MNLAALIIMFLTNLNIPILRKQCLTTNFRELRYGEVRRITIPRTSVNKGMKKGLEGCYTA